MSTPPTWYSYTAKNFATESENRIHADDVARQFGFRGGLVPGVASFAYAAQAIATHSDDTDRERWLGGGRLAMRLLSPVYDGQPIEVGLEADGTIHLRDVEGVECVQGRYGFDPIDTRNIPGIDAAGLPDHREPASLESLATGTVLGTVRHRIGDVEQSAYLSSIGLSSEEWHGWDRVHPGMLLLDCNDVLVRTVRLGPWIHVETDISLLRPLALGTEVEVRSRTTACYARKGHEIVELDVVFLADGVGVAAAKHTAIFRPRVQR